MTLVSIILPFKNASQWIQETLDSIVEQSFENWELICVDDHSSDNGPSIITSFEDPKNRIRVVANNGAGIINALQTGFKLATGEYITRMDADDLMTPHRLHLMVDAIEKAQEQTIVTGKVKYFSDGELSDGFIGYQNWINERVYCCDFYQHIFRECTVASPNWMGRRKEFEKFQLFEHLNYPEDYDLLFRWFHEGFRIEGIDEVTLKWRDHPSRTSKNSDTYNQQSLFELKMNWFNGLYPGKSIALLGAGTKGKIVADILLTQGRVLNWYDLNYSNYNVPILGMDINNYEDITEDLLLIAIYPKDRIELERFIESKGYMLGENAWYL